MTNISFIYSSYHELMAKLKELAREDIGDPKIPLERKRVKGIPSAALSTTDNNKKRYSTGQFKGKCHWCNRVVHMKFDCLIMKAGKPRVVIKSEANMIKKWMMIVRNSS